MIVRSVEIVLTIPDNEAETALETLRRLGLDVAHLSRADVYRIELDPRCEQATLEALRDLETIYNPNKHRLVVRSQASPQAGELWIDEPRESGASSQPVQIAGRTLPGVHRIERLAAWRLADEQGKAAPRETLERASDLLLCNPAFQRVQYGR
jgi:phosphoribosylformylglycinamidine (FGAM) synthase PurS component